MIFIISAQTGNAPDLSLSFGKGPARGTSAPASPAKSRESLLQRVQSLTGAARDQGASIIGSYLCAILKIFSIFNSFRNGLIAFYVNQ